MKSPRFLSRWLKDESGNATVELVFWVPLLALILTITTDATLLMYEQQRLMNVARDSSRQVSLGVYNETEAQNLMLQRVSNENAVANVAQSNGFVTTSVSVPSADYAIFTGLFGGQIAVEVSMWVENNET